MSDRRTISQLCINVLTYDIRDKTSASKTTINNTYLGTTGDNQDWGTNDGWNETGEFDISDLLINVTT